MGTKYYAIEDQTHAAWDMVPSLPEAKEIRDRLEDEHPDLTFKIRRV